MTTRTQTSSSPFSRLSLVAKGAQSPPLRTPKRATGDDDYIPYNGPYEAPPPKRKERNRDSWGDPLYDEDGNDMIQELHQRYVPSDQAHYPWHDEDGERKGRPRARTHSGVSGVSGRTVSSGTVDPHRASVSAMRKSSHHANVARPPVPSYINLDAAGGVGESPAPAARLSREIQGPKRSSLASIFAFAQSKKTPLSPAKVALPTSPPPVSPLATRYTRALTTQPQRPGSGPPSIYSVSSDRHQTSTFASQEGDAYHSYYNFTPAADQFGKLPLPRNATPPLHPYAYNQPQRDIPDPPQTAPITITSPKLKFTTSQPPQRSGFPQPQEAQPPRALKNYASTPNLRDAASSPIRQRKPLLQKGKDRWLSAETWCDAVLFPRPRLRVEDAQLLLRGASGRIVSPPGSPVFGGFNAPNNPDRPEGVTSRVLAHSRSMVNLNAEAGPSKLTSEPAPRREAPLPAVPPPQVVLPTQERPPRPKSFAWDDLALPSPVPSLARVLEEGQILEHQRKKWQMQATGSFQNTRARSLSRSRAKSLTQRGGNPGQSNMDYLAARSLLGNQNVVPVVPRRVHIRTGSQSGTNTDGTTTFNTRTSHSHSDSLVKTTSKTSMSQSQGHSRSESWSRTAFKKAAAICYDDGALSPADEKLNAIESAIRGGGTRVIRLADPAQIPVDMSGPLSAFSPRNGVSPVPSAVSDTQMGIALSTPPPNDSASERESIHLPSHPYAQSGVSYTYHNAGASTSKPVDRPERLFCAPSPPAAGVYHLPSIRRAVVSTRILSDRASHGQRCPAAFEDVGAAFTRDCPRDSAGELLYSPFMSERSASPEQEKEPESYGKNRKSTVTILDTVGLGETLAYAVEEENNRDSGLGTSEELAPDVADTEWADDGQAAAVEAHHPYRIQRKPVQYDISRTPYTPKKSGVSNDTNHTAASSPLEQPTVNYEHRLMPPTPPLPTNQSGSSPGAESTVSSPPRSPPTLGSVDDLDEFRDLFYKPNLTDEVLNNLSRPTSTRHPSVTWDIASTTRTQRTRTGSGLTTLARQLSQEFEEMRASRQRLRSGERGLGVEHQSLLSIPDNETATTNSEPPPEALSAFQPSSYLPEDVGSSRASSPIDGPLDDEDEHATSSPHSRMSLAGQMAFIEPEPVVKGAIPIPRTGSTLQPHSADPTRSSYMTESDLSRMSNLSDFPVPPPQHMTPAHMSLLSSYFHEHAAADRSVPEDESQSAVTFTPRIGERF
ncbi:hypothetical protein DFH06DRAFT_1290016 [Mycena polygramma]|nr:hypothetical protein DFH06DRAFT_1290016 [Mycena polygramma]